MRKKYFIALLLVLVLVLWPVASQSQSLNGLEVEKELSIEQLYPLRPGIPEWRNISDIYGSIQIDEELVASLSTEQLLSAVEKYPLLPIVVAYVDYIGSIDELCEAMETHILARFNAFHSLKMRDDLNEIVKKRQDEIEPIVQNYYRLGISKLEPGGLKLVFKSVLYRVLLPINDKARFYEEPSKETILTPNGSYVQIYRHSELSQSELNELDYIFTSTYPNATLIGHSTNKYNCHSYAWAQDDYSSYNTFWIYDPGVYMTDNSYNSRSITSTRAGDKIYYKNKKPSDSPHSAEVYKSSSNVDSIVVVSKWGAGPLMRHKIAVCPYYAGNLSAWRRAGT